MRYVALDRQGKGAMFIRPATSEDFAALKAVELASFETLRGAGAVDGNPSASSDEELQQYLDNRLLLVGCDPEGNVVGYCGGYVTEDFLHIGEMDVHPDWQRKGLGRRLLTMLINEGRARKLAGATLTTDRFAPFNAPFYATLGFRLVEKEGNLPRLKKILEAESGEGLDPLRRVAMVLMF
jgi:ribosomal protein S18 acetylase RimI-like enzyme